MPYSTEDMARRAAREIPQGAIVNLGIGLPTQVADYLPEGHAWLHSENGLLGMGPFPYDGDEDPSLINAGKQTVTALPGGSTFDSATSFGDDPRRPRRSRHPGRDAGVGRRRPRQLGGAQGQDPAASAARWTSPSAAGASSC